MSSPICLSDSQKSHLDPIKELTELLKEHLPTRFVIAGGYPRDFLLQSPPNDIDIYLASGSIYKTVMAKALQALTLTGRFDFFPTKGEMYTFVEGIFSEITEQEQKIPKYRIQLIAWYSNPMKAVREFDLEHCQFFIPFTNPQGYPGLLQDGDLYAYNQGALDSLTNRTLTLNEEWFRNVNDLNPFEGIANLERIFKRIVKFQKRNFKLEDAEKFKLIKLIEKIFLKIERQQNYLKSNGVKEELEEEFFTQSVLLGEVAQAEMYSLNGATKSLYRADVVCRRVAKELVFVLGEHPTSLLFSGSELIREAGRELLEELEKRDRI